MGRNSTLLTTLLLAAQSGYAETTNEVKGIFAQAQVAVGILIVFAGVLSGPPERRHRTSEVSR
jgi:hypothetical protein